MERGSVAGVQGAKGVVRLAEVEGGTAHNAPWRTTAPPHRGSQSVNAVAEIPRGEGLSQPPRQGE
eukprot:scaffold20370_cov56-Isochrysis_galbana.AAC.1